MTVLNLPKCKTYSVKGLNLLFIIIYLLFIDNFPSFEKELKFPLLLWSIIHPYDKLTCVISDHSLLLLKEIISWWNTFNGDILLEKSECDYWVLWRL